VAGRASIVGAAETSVGKVRDHNEDSHFIDLDRGIFAVCDGMGGHAAGEVASGLAVKVLRDRWASEATQQVADHWLEEGTPDARKRLLAAIQGGVIAAHDAIVAEAQADKTKTGMGTTLVGALVVGGDIVFAQCGDSRAYMVRDGIAMQLTEDHTLLARLLAAGVDVDTSAEGARFKSMLTNALGIGQECKAATFVVPVADGDRFLLCSDGITEYVQEAEIGEVLTAAPSPARAAQRLVEMALQRGGGDNATALVVRVLESGVTNRPAEQLHRENKAINACPLWAKVTPQGRLRALRIALPRDHANGERVPAQTLGDRVAWIIVDGEVEQDGILRGPGSLLYPEALLTDAQLPDKEGLAVAQSDVRALALRSDDFREVCDDDAELGEVLLEALGAEIAARQPRRGRLVVSGETDGRGATDPNLETAPTLPPRDVPRRPDEVRDVPRTKTPSPPPLQPVDKADLETGPTLPPRDVPRVKPVSDIESAPTLPPNTRIAKPSAATLPKIPRAQTPPPLGRSPTPPKGRPTVPPTAKPIEIKPDDVREALARGPTAPAIQIPRTDTKDRPAAERTPGAQSNRMHPRGSTPPAERLIVPKNERADAEAQLDRALADLTVDREWADLDDGDEAPPPRPHVPARPTTEEPEISIEGGEPIPPPQPIPVAATPAAPAPVTAKKPYESDPEISIERLVEIEVEAPLNEPEVDNEPLPLEPVFAAEPRDDEPSAPEIIVMRPGRAITADDTPLVAGAIDPPAKPKRAKRQTDAPD
jgi:serine/threonine protein phosphatase PrpC